MKSQSKAVHCLCVGNCTLRLSSTKAYITINVALCCVAEPQYVDMCTLCLRIENPKSRLLKSNQSFLLTLIGQALKPWYFKAAL